jgi:hypothetical protein
VCAAGRLTAPLRRCCGCHATPAVRKQRRALGDISNAPGKGLQRGATTQKGGSGPRSRSAAGSICAPSAVSSAKKGLSLPSFEPEDIEHAHLGGDTVDYLQDVGIDVDAVAELCIGPPAKLAMDGLPVRAEEQSGAQPPLPSLLFLPGMTRGRGLCGVPVCIGRLKDGQADELLGWSAGGFGSVESTDLFALDVDIDTIQFA